MTYIYHKHRSQIIDCLHFPKALDHRHRLSTYADGLSYQELQVLTDVLAVDKEFRQLLEPYQERIHKYYPVAYWSDLLYQLILEEGQDPDTIEDLYPYLLAASEETIQKALLLAATLFAGETEPAYPPSEADLFRILETEVFANDQQRWNFFWAYRHPKETVAGLVALYKELVPLYRPYQERYADEREAFVRDFDPEQLSDSPIRSQIEPLIGESGQPVELLVLSPCFPEVLYYKMREGGQPYLYLYSRIPQLFKASQQPAVDLAVVLKTLGDDNRYQVMKELAKGELKNKEIAEKLDITAANVSFHTQKLTVAKLLLIDTGDKRGGPNYHVNKPLLRESIRRLKEDFDL